MAQDVILATNRLQVTVDTVLKNSVSYIGIDTINPIVEQIGRQMTVTNPLMGTPSYSSVREQWQVEIVMRDGRKEYIALGDITSQPTWTNNAVGYAAAEDDIYTAAT